MSVPVRRARKATRGNVEKRRALYVEQTDIVTRDIVTRPKGDVNKQTRSKRFGVHWEDSDMETNEKTPLLDDVREKIRQRSEEQVAEAEEMVRGAERLQNDTADAFTKIHMRPSFWKKCCMCCFHSEEEE